MHITKEFTYINKSMYLYIQHIYNNICTYTFIFFKCFLREETIIFLLFDAQIIS